MSKKIHKTSIGGQAVLEGIMMRGVDKASLSVRKASGEIYTETFPVRSIKDGNKFLKLPFIRGIIGFIESMIFGYKCLTRSAELVEFEDDEPEAKQSKFDKWLSSKLDEKFIKGFTIVAMVFSLIFGIVVFMFLPTLIVKGLVQIVDLGNFRSLVEGVIKISLFVGYLALVSLMKDIQRVFAFHGAEHKTIACYEHGEELTVENVRKYSRFHPRCGTSFLLIVLIISIIIFFFVTWDNMYLRVVLKLALLPIVVGIAYEFIKLAGRYDNIFTRIISAPGLLLQNLTTREPDDEQIEVGIAALSAVLTDNKEDDKW